MCNILFEQKICKEVNWENGKPSESTACKQTHYKPICKRSHSLSLWIKLYTCVSWHSNISTNSLFARLHFRNIWQFLHDNKKTINFNIQEPHETWSPKVICQANRLNQFLIRHCKYFYTFMSIIILHILTHFIILDLSVTVSTLACFNFKIIKNIIWIFKHLKQ